MAANRSVPAAQQTRTLLISQPVHAPTAPQSASSLLSTLSPASAAPVSVDTLDKAVALSAAYTKDMRALQQQGLEMRLERAGEGIEGVRERAEGVQAALGEVKL
jgi:hypothetical protein